MQEDLKQELNILLKKLKEKEDLILFLRKELKEVEAQNRALHNVIIVMKNKRKDC
jgi:hypothetical protein